MEKGTDTLVSTVKDHFARVWDMWVEMIHNIPDDEWAKGDIDYLIPARHLIHIIVCDDIFTGDIPFDEYDDFKLFEVPEWGTSPEEARFIPTDVRHRQEVIEIPRIAQEWFGRVDIWINGAAIAPPNNYLEISDKEFEDVLNVNIKAVFMACQVIGKHWIEKGERGCIINMSSMSAIRPLSRSFIYSLSKASVTNLTQNLAREWAEFGIRVNALCPGFFPAGQNRQILDEKRVNAIMQHTPMGRFGEPDELIGATLLLASEKAGSFITGTNMVVDGGFSVTSI